MINILKGLSIRYNNSIIKCWFYGNHPQQFRCCAAFQSSHQFLGCMLQRQQTTLLPFSDRTDFFRFKFLFFITLVLFSCSTAVFMFGFVGITQNFFLYFRLGELRETHRGLCCIALLSRPGEGPRWRWAVRLEISSPSNTARGLLSLSPFCAFLGSDLMFA